MDSTIFDALRHDHERQRRLVAQLKDTSGDSKKRNAVFELLKAELSHHAVAEERHFYVPLINCEWTQEKARHSIAEHHEIDELVAELDSIDMASPAWLNRAKHLFQRIEHHLEEEEHEVFPLAGKALSQKQKQDLAYEYTASMEELRADVAHA